MIGAAPRRSCDGSSTQGLCHVRTPRVARKAHREAPSAIATIAMQRRAPGRRALAAPTVCAGGTADVLSARRWCVAPRAPSKGAKRSGWSGAWPRGTLTARLSSEGSPRRRTNKRIEAIGSGSKKRGCGQALAWATRRLAPVQCEPSLFVRHIAPPPPHGTQMAGRFRFVG